jgi:hypothetical protein
MKTTRINRALVLASAVAATLQTLGAFAGTATNTTGPVQQGTSDGSNNYANNNPAVTISFAGQTALQNFDESPGITELAPGTEIVLHDGTDGTPVTYIAPNNNSDYVQLANPNFGTPDTNPGTPSSPSTNTLQIASAIQLQWHSEGSVDGFYDLINDQIGFNQTTGPISNEALRTPSSSNPTWINTNEFTAGGSSNGFTLDNSAADDLANTYSTTVYNQATGQNLLGGQNRVQFSVGEYPTEAFAVSGTPSPSATPGSPGYGQGNPALKTGSVLTNLGTSGGRQQFQSASIANESTSIDDPQTDAAYAAGPWNTAGANNITSTPFAVTAVTYSANPGTGLERLNESDTQWLQTTGRLQNGALFNVVARTVDTGQRVVFAANTGVDPSWAVGSDDDGNSTSSNNAKAQHSIGSAFRVDGKTSGSEAETTVSQGRMALGALSIPEAQKATGTAPIRALDIGFNYTSSTDPTLASPGSDDNDSNPEFVRANFNTIVSSNASTRYQAVLISHYNTVKAPNQAALNAELTSEGIDPATATTAQQATAWAAIPTFDPSTAETDGTPSFPVTGIKGDPTGDVAAFLSNIVNSVGTAAAGLTSTTVNNPADNLFINGYLIPGLLDYTRQTDGGPITPVTLSSAAQAEQNSVESNYGSEFTTDGTFASNNQTIGSSATYGAGNSSYTPITGGSSPTINGSIPITAKDVTFSGGTITGWTSASNTDLTAQGGNYLFGNFNQTGVRDYSAVLQAVNAALSLTQVDVVGHGGGDSMFTSGGGVTNSTVIPSLDNTNGTPGWVATGTDTKGDLIALGDYQGQGTFNGQDLYLLAIGASLTSANSTTNLDATATTFADVVRDPTDVLRKNEALNFINTYLTTGFGGTNYPTAAAYLLKTGAAVLEGTSPNNTDLVDTGNVNPVTNQENYIPYGATNLNVIDPVTGYAEYTFDPTGANAFNPADVIREGAIDFNDAVVVDADNGDSYENQTQSLASTALTPVTGAVGPINLAVVQQVDGESAIGSADLAAENAALTGVGNSYWFSYNLQKTGPGTITWARTGGTVTVYSGASFEISSGVVQIGGTQDPFSDNNASGPTVGNHLAVTVDHGAQLQFLNSTANVNYTVASLSIDTTTNSQVDIANHQLFIDYNSGSDPIATIQSYLKSGFNGGNWNGPGIISSTVAAANANPNNPQYGIGFSDGADTINGHSIVSGLSSGEIEIKYTLLGDANLDGTVNGADFSILAANFGQGYTNWDQGNFLFTPAINGADFSALAHNFGQGDSGAAGTVSSADIAALDAFATANGLSLPTFAVVPEPAATGLFVLAGMGWMARRRRKQTHLDRLSPT